MFARGCFRKPARFGGRDVYQFIWRGHAVLVVSCLVKGVRVWLDCREVARGEVLFARVQWTSSDPSFTADIAGECARLVCSQFVLN